MQQQAIQPPPCVYVVFTAEITPNTVETLIQAFLNVLQQRIPKVHLAISTPGGQVQSGITLYNFLRGLPIKLTAHNIGNVDSIGNAVFLAADTRYACKQATFMFHGVGVNTPARRFDEAALRELLDGIEADQRRIGSIICERTNITAEEAKGLFRDAQTMSAEQARKRGIIDGIREFSWPLGAPVVSLVFKR